MAEKERKKLKKAILVIFILVTAVFLARFLIGGNEDTWICTGGEWVKHGNPSAPKPVSVCGDEKGSEGEEVCTSPSGKEMGLAEAEKIAQDSCKEGSLKETYFCNSYTGTWWIDFSPDKPVNGCDPACVVNVETKDAEVNWRCTGLIEPTQ